MSARNISRAPIFYQTQENFIIKEENSEKNNTKTKIPIGGIIFKDRSIEIPVETSIKYMNSEGNKFNIG